MSKAYHRIKHIEVASHVVFHRGSLIYQGTGMPLNRASFRSCHLYSHSIMNQYSYHYLSTKNGNVETKKVVVLLPVKWHLPLSSFKSGNKLEVLK